MLDELTANKRRFLHGGLHFELLVESFPNLDRYFGDLRKHAHLGSGAG
jgi:hypothetical protein